MKTVRKILSAIVLASMLLSLFPAAAFAQEEIPQGITINPKNNYVYANGTPIVIKEEEETVGGNAVKNTYIYDINGETKLFDKPLEEVPYVFGGAQTATVASSKIVMESGSIGTRTSTGKGYLYGGGGGNVEGLAEIIVNGGFVESVYGCGTGITGSVRIEYSNTVSSLQALVVGGKGIIRGDVDIVLNNPNLTTLCGGGNGTKDTYVGGNVNITINGGSIENIYGGCVNGYVNGLVNITINGNTTVNSAFHPMRKTYNNLVYGGAYVYVPETFDTGRITTTYNDGTPNNEISIFKNGVQVYGPAQVTSDSDGNVFANGVSVVIKTYEADGKTYLYDKQGVNKLLKFPIDNYTIYGGSTEKTVDQASITMESGKVAAIYGGGRNGNVKGNSFVVLNGGVVDSVYGSGLNGAVNATSCIKVSEGVQIKEKVYSNSGGGDTSASVIWIPGEFDMDKIQPGNNVRIFKGSVEMVDANTAIPDTVTVQGKFIFANGIPVVVKKDAADGRTYVYDRAGMNKLLDTEVNGMEIYGGSLKGVVDSTSVTFESGTVARIYGGGYRGGVSGTAKVTVTGGDITEVIYGGSYDGDVGSTDIYVSGPYVAKGVNAGSRNGCVLGDTKVLLIDSVAKGLYAGTGGDGRVGCPSSDVLGNASYTLVGGMAESIYGGCKSGVIRGTSTITLEGQVVIKKVLNAQGNSGVTGGAFVYVPENFTHMDKIEKGEGISIQLTGRVPEKPVPDVRARTEGVLSTEGDDGKLVFRFIHLPAAEGQMMGRSGEAIYITFPNGENMLVDAAEVETAGHLIDTLKRMNITKIDHLVASHYHSDHIGGMARVLDEFDVGTLYKPGFNVNFTGAYYTDLKAKINDPARTFHTVDLWRGDRLEIGGVAIEVLNPVNSESVKTVMSGNASTEDHNNNSIVMKMTFGENTALLTGDIYTRAELELLEAYSDEDLKVDLLKLPHHGDTTSSDPAFVAAVNPKIAVITHFSDTLIVNNRYKALGADTYVTGEDGIVKVAYDGSRNPAEVTTEYYVIKPEIAVTGGSGTINVDSTTETVMSYTYRVHDQYGHPIENAQVTVTLTDDMGNLIDDRAIAFKDGSLIVKGKPPVPYVVVNFTYGNARTVRRVVFREIEQTEDDSYTPPSTPPSPSPSPSPSPTPSVSPKAPEDPKEDDDKAVNAVVFEDVKAHWAGKYVHALAARDILKGRDRKTFDLEGGMTRAEFASIIVRAFDLPESGNAVFIDVAGDAWYARDINSAYAAGLIAGKGNGTFAPDAFISREEMAVIAVRAYKLKANVDFSGTKAAFADAGEISEWAEEAVDAAYELGIIKGSDGLFAPKSYMTRAEGATLLYGLLVKLGLLLE